MAHQGVLLELSPPSKYADLLLSASALARTEYLVPEVQRHWLV